MSNRPLLLTCLLLLPAAARATDFHVIPFDVDPPIVVDGDLGDWTDVPNESQLDRREQVTWGVGEWAGPDDLSARVRLAWRSGGIWISAIVKDDALVQPFRGPDAWKADHVNLFLDFTPGVDPERRFFGEGQYQVGLSPGVKPDGTLKPEVVFFYPEQMDHGGKCLIAARREAYGYVIEAYVPFAVLGDRKMQQGDDCNFTVTLSDADNEPAVQEAWMTLGTKPWKSGRDMLGPAVVGDGSGKAQLRPRVVPIQDEFNMLPGDDARVIRFEVDSIPAGRDAHVFFRGRVHYERVGGQVSNALQLKLNGEPLDAGRLSNRPPESTMSDGRANTFVQPDGRMIMWYTPSFEAVDKDPHYALIDGVKACEHEFRVTDLLRVGENELTFEYLAAQMPDVERKAVFDDVELRIKAPVAAKRWAPAPTGEIPTLEPAPPPATPVATVAHKGTDLRVKVAGQTFDFASRFSSPDGQWNRGSSKFYRHRRAVERSSEWIEVRDTFTNLTDQNVPIIQEHTCELGRAAEKFWLSGFWIPSGEGNRSSPENPSIFVTTKRAGLGMIAVNDEFRVHHQNRASKSDGEFQMADRGFVLRPGAEYTAVFYLVPVAKPDFWAFVNAARRAMDVNFTMDRCFAFAFHREPIYQWSDERLTDFVRFKSCNFITQSNEASRFKGRYAYSRAFLAVPRRPYIDFHERIETLFPGGDVKHAIYYHCFIDNYDDEGDEQFADSRLLDAAGNHVNYGGSHAVDKLYVPTLNNAFGRQTAKVVDSLLDEIGVDGIFWDEWTHSRVQYTYNDTEWDGCSADIDRDTYTIQRLKSSLALLTLPWRLEQIKRMQERGPVMTNGAPHTRTMQEQRPLAFTETGTVTYCREMLLYTPIGLGDHLTVRTETEAYRAMLRQLDHGCLHAWYSHEVVPTHKTLTEHMYPFTPIELHEGTVIGAERILTNRSGYFGWGDSSRFDAYVYDRDGRPTDEIDVPAVERGGKTYAEVRLPEGYAAAIVRR